MTDKVCLITGGGRGIGAAVAQSLPISPHWSGSARSRNRRRPPLTDVSDITGQTLIVEGGLTRTM